MPAEGYDKANSIAKLQTRMRRFISDSARAVSVYPVKPKRTCCSSGAYEGGTYDRTFSWGDGYHALGFYQFDHRYGLQNFLIACYYYNPVKYVQCRAVHPTFPPNEFKAADAIRQKNEGVAEFTELGKALDEAWVAAAYVDGVGAADGEFARLQDGWAYENYYMPAERYLASRGIDISDRNDAVKGLCWGMSNFFGTSGWRKFVGGISDGYDWDGVYHYLSEQYVSPGTVDRRHVRHRVRQRVVRFLAWFRTSPCSTRASRSITRAGGTITSARRPSAWPSSSVRAARRAQS